MSSFPTNSTIKSICILRLSSIGDVTHVLPVVESLKQQLPEASLTWVVGKTEAQLLEGLPGVELIVFDKHDGLAAYRNLWRQLRGRRFDVLLHMQVSIRANIASALIRARRRIGYDRDRSKDLHGLFVNERIAGGSRQHVLECLASFPEALGLKAASPRWTIPLTDTDYRFADQCLENGRLNIVISPSASHELRNWPAERYAALADHAVQKYRARIILTGGPDEQDRDYCQHIQAAMASDCLNTCGRDTLKQLAALLEKADLLIAPDTGPAHIANAMGTDVLGLFASSNPYRSGPYHSLRWCVNRYPQALKRFTGKTDETARWGTKAEFEGAMELIEVADATAVLDAWVARNHPERQ